MTYLGQPGATRFGVTAVLSLLLAGSGGVGGPPSPALAIDGRGTDGPAIVRDESVVALHAESLIYPLDARLHAVQGVVVISATINPEGRVAAARALSGPSRLLSSSIQNARKWRFAGRGQRTAIVVYWFRIRGQCEPPCRSGFEFYPPNLVVITVGRETVTP